MEPIVRKTCRLCGSSDMQEVFSLGEQYINDFVPPEKIGTGGKAPLELVLCERCSLLQLRHTAPQELLYSRYYWYRSGVTDTMRVALRDITEEVEAMVPLNTGDVVLDIGANDGTLLASYTKEGILRIGCEPANNLVDLLRESCEYVMHDFWDYEEYMKLASEWGVEKAKVITAIGMFYDLEDPNEFVSDIKKCLDNKGIWIIQMAYLPLMLKMNAFDNCCHEHIEYYSLLSLENLLQRHHMEVFYVELNDINGGSFRVYVKHSNNKPLKSTAAAKNRILTLRKQEKAMHLDTMKPYREFEKRVLALRELCYNFIKKAVSKGKTISIYGASTKGNTLLQYYKLNNTLIKNAAERNPSKWGLKTIGTNIPIVSEVEVRNLKPNYLLILPWHFLDEFQKREKEFLNSGGKFIVPLPDFKIIEE